MDNFLNDKVLRAMFVVALGIVFTLIQIVSNDTNKILLALGIVWCAVSIGWTIKAIQEDWKNP